jgi:hypothetical protein
MSLESQPRPSQLEVLSFHGRSLSAWHRWLTTDQDTGEHNGYLRVPCSRYGSNGDDCAWWAIAAEVVFIEANGEDDEPEDALDFLMCLAVNDHASVARNVRDYWQLIPEDLRAQLGVDYNEVKEMAYDADV